MKTDFITIPQDFNSLGLSAIEKMALSLVWGFDRNNGVFYGSLQYVQDWLGCSKPTAIKTLNTLIDKGLIRKGMGVFENQARHIYQINWERLNNLTEVKNFNPEEVKKFNSEGKETLPNNIVDNIDINNIVKKEIYKEKRFVKPTISEIADYIKSQGYELNAKSFYYHYEANGWKVGRTAMEDWKAAVNNWEHRRNEERKVAPKKEESYVAQGMRQLAELKRKMEGRADEQ